MSQLILPFLGLLYLAAVILVWRMNRQKPAGPDFIRQNRTAVSLGLLFLPFLLLGPALLRRLAPGSEGLLPLLLFLVAALALNLLVYRLICRK